MNTNVERKGKEKPKERMKERRKERKKGKKKGNQPTIPSLKKEMKDRQE